MTVRNGITGMTRMTGMNWMARISGMTVMNGITVVTRMTESWTQLCKCRALLLV